MKSSSKVSGQGRVVAALLLLLSLFAWRAEATAAQLTLGWVDNSNDEVGFSVERSTGSGGTFAQIVTIPTGVTAYADASVAGGTTYCYRVRAFNADSYSSYSNVACGAATQTFNLAVVKVGDGSGTVSSAPAGINCGANCSGIYPGGSTVTLNASPATGSIFSGWSGGGCTGTAPCAVKLSAATVVTATFASQPVPPPPGPSSTAPTAITINAPTITSNANAPVSVTVSATTGTPTGTVSLVVDNGAPLTATLSNGQVTFTLLSPGVGDHNLQASYAAQGNFDASGATATLHVNAAPPSGGDRLQFGSATYSARATWSRVAIDVVRPGSTKTGSTATVHYSTSDGTAQAGVNYAATSGTLTFKPGVTKRTFFVQILLNGATTPKTVNLTLSNLSGVASLGAPSTALLTVAGRRSSASRSAAGHSFAAAAGDTVSDAPSN